MDLSLVSIEQLMTELENRFDVVVFAGKNDPVMKVENVVTFYRGGASTALGIAETLVMDIKHDLEMDRYYCDECGGQ